MNAEDETLLNASEVARTLGVSSAAISQWLAEGEFPHAFKLNPNHSKSPWRIPRADVTAYIEKRARARGYFYVPPAQLANL